MAFDHVRNSYEKKGVFLSFCFLADGVVLFCFLLSFERTKGRYIETKQMEKKEKKKPLLTPGKTK